MTPREPVDAARVTVIGEALIDLVAVDAHGGYQARPGGSPYNIAVGLARLGVPTSLLARLADDAFGRQLRRHAQAEGVDLGCAPRAAEPTTLAVVSIDDAAQATYDFYLEGTADWQWTEAETAGLPADTAVLHFGSLASWTPPGSERIHDLVGGLHRAGRTLISYDPNVRPLVLGDAARGRSLVERSVAVSHVVKASRDDVEWLYPGDGLERVAARWLDLGALLVVLTDGADGALAVPAGGQPSRIAGRRTDVVDTVGAGDAFSSGLLAALYERGLAAPDRLAGLTGPERAAVLADAVLVSALTCARQGADPPTRAERDAARQA